MKTLSKSPKLLKTFTPKLLTINNLKFIPTASLPFTQKLYPVVPKDETNEEPITINMLHI